MSLTFDGVNDYCYRVLTSQPPFEYNTVVFALWVCPDTGSGYDTILAVDKSGGTDYMRIQIYHGQVDPPVNPLFRVVFYDGADTIVLAHTPADIYTWHHIAVVVLADSEDSVKQVYRGLYIDGELEDDDATEWDNTFDTSILRFYLGCHQSGLTRTAYYPGMICEVGIWATTAGGFADIDWVESMKRFSALAINPYLLDFYYPLISDGAYGLRDLKLDHTLTKSGATWTDPQDHPAVVWPCNMG